MCLELVRSYCECDSLFNGYMFYACFIPIEVVTIAVEMICNTLILYCNVILKEMPTKRDGKHRATK